MERNSMLLMASSRIGQTYAQIMHIGLQHAVHLPMDQPLHARRQSSPEDEVSLVVYIRGHASLGELSQDVYSQVALSYCE